MSQFHGRRNENGDWEWEGATTSVLRVYTAPLLIGAILALAMLAYVFASHGWSFSPVAPNSCATAGQSGVQNESCTPICGTSDGVSVQNNDCTPCPESATGASVQNNDECHTCSPRADGGDAQTQWFDLPTCTPAPTPSPSPTLSPSPTPNCLDNPGYHVSLTSPSVPNSSKDYRYKVDGCGVQQLKFVKLSGCWWKDDIDSVKTDPSKTVQILDDGTVKVIDLSDADLPLIVTIHFKASHVSAENHTDVWVWYGPGNSDGFGSQAGGPKCEDRTPTPTPKPTVGEPATQTPAPTPTVIAATETPAPTPHCDGEVDENTGECHTCSPGANGSDATIQWFDLPPCTPAPTPTPSAATATPTPTPTCPGGEVDPDTGICHTCSPRADGGDATIQWFNLPTCTPAPTPETDITLVKTDDPDPAERGGTLTYNITVTNVSSQNAENVVVTDTPPSAVNPVSATPGQGSCTGMVCSLGTLTPGQAVGIAVVVTVRADAPAVFTNLACAATSSVDKHPENNCDDEDTHVPSPTATPLPATSTPKAMPRTGGLPGDGSSNDRLLLGLGVGVLIAGAFMAAVARRRVYKSTMEM